MFSPTDVTDVDAFEVLEHGNNTSMATVPDPFTVDEDLGDPEEESVQIDHQENTFFLKAS